MLHRSPVEFVADPGEQRLALAPVFVKHANLDQLVSQQIDVDFVQNGWRQSVLADADDRTQRMRFGAKVAALRGC